jgi:hypothetical protein
MDLHGGHGDIYVDEHPAQGRANAPEAYVSH